MEGRVFEAVERLLDAGESYTALGVQRIAEEAGVARSTFYVHFADKSDLLMRLTQSATGDLFAASESWVRGSHDDGRAGLRRTAAHIIAQYRAHAGALTALTEVAAYDPAVAEFWRSRIEGFVQVLRERLEADQAAGRTPAGVHVESTARWIAWGTERTVSEHVALADPSEDDALAESMARAVWLAMYGDA